MKLPIDIHIEGETIWSEYSQERNMIRSFDDLKRFIKRWSDIYVKENLKEHLFDDSMVVGVIHRIADESISVSEIIIPFKILRAMIYSMEYLVPLNTAFIQGNGGIGAFEAVSY